MVVNRNNGVVGLTGFSDKKTSGLLFGPKKSSRGGRMAGFHCMALEIEALLFAVNEFRKKNLMNTRPSIKWDAENLKPQRNPVSCRKPCFRGQGV